MIDPKDVVFFQPPGLSPSKVDLFNRLGRHVCDAGGSVLLHDFDKLARLAESRIPAVNCHRRVGALVDRWQRNGTPWLYWDRGYFRRKYSAGLPTSTETGFASDKHGAEGFYRWHRNSYQMTAIRDVPGDRWKALRLDHCVKPWQAVGGKIVVADTGADYWQMRGLGEDWSKRTAETLRAKTSRPIVIRDKESKVPLDRELIQSHALLSHGSIAAVEAAVMGYPVFADSSSAAALVGQTDFAKIEEPVRPDRTKWLHSLAYCQFNEKEICDGTLWTLLE